MKPLLIFLSIIFFTLEVKAQKNTEATNNKIKNVNEYGQPLPSFPGGWDAWYKFLQINLKWPKKNAGQKIFPVTVTMSIEKNGTLTNFKVLMSPGAKFSRAVLAVLQKSPKWIPIKKDGSPVRTPHWTLRIGFYNSNV